MLQLTLGIRDELVVDNFAGGGGASTGIEAGIGRAIDIAVNHDPVALAVHQLNHPATKHYATDIRELDPRVVTRNQPVGLAWFSPDCTHHSRARGGKPTRIPGKRSRALAKVVIRWAAQVRPRVIMLENVEEWLDWGPLVDGLPCPERKGITFDRWVYALRKFGYTVEWRSLRACDYGAPTIRRRLFLIARCDGRPIVWPKPTHGPGLLPYRTAAECIDWLLPCPSIFNRARPLAENTLRRIARGIRRYVLEAAEPFIVPITHHGDARAHSINEPLRTITTASRGELSLIAPTLINTRNGERIGQDPRVRAVTEPAWTVTSQGSQHALVAAFLAKHYGGNETPGAPLDVPTSTITAKDHHALVVSHLLKLQQNSVGQDVREPLHTVMAGATRFAEVRAFLLKYYGVDQDPRLGGPMHTITTKHRFGLVTVRGEEYQIVDIGMRMLQPRELFTAQGFPVTYQIDGLRPDGKPITKTDQVRLCGNSVSPVIPEALVRANFHHELSYRSAAA